MFLPHSVRPPQSCKSVSQLWDLIYHCLYISIFISSINMSLPTPFVKAKFADNSWLGLPKDTDLQRQATIKCFWAASSNLSRNSFNRVFLNAQCKMDHDGFPLHGVLDSHLKLNKPSEKWSNYFSNLMDPNLDVCLLFGKNSTAAGTRSFQRFSGKLPIALWSFNLLNLLRTFWRITSSSLQGMDVRIWCNPAKSAIQETIINSSMVR